MEDPNITVSREGQQKFEFYFTGLVFTILGLSIQTAKLPVNHYQYALEVSSWVLFMITGIVGLSRMEFIPVALLQHGYQNTEQKKLSGLKQALLTSRVVLDPETQVQWNAERIQNAINEFEVNIKKRCEIMAKLEKRLQREYNIHRWTFIIGLLCLMASRAWLK